MQPVSFGINGFGRIGRTAFRVWWKSHLADLDLKVINTSGSMELDGWAYLLKHDSNFGLFDQEITINQTQSKDDVTDDNPVLGTLTVGDKEILVTAQRSPDKIPWEKHGVQTVLESTGVFNTEDKARLHLAAGAKRVVLSAPAKGGNISTSVIGINDFDANNQIRSNASCTTNCVAPVAQLMVDNFGVEKAMLTTIHAYTDDQNLHDNSHKDPRRARAAALNMVPTSTGAAKATAEVIPALKGLFDGLSIRVPVPVGSISDMVFLTSRDTTIQEVNAVMTKAAGEARWQGILAVTNEAVVSSDIVGRSESSIVDLSLTNVIGGNLVKVISWYDNEWGYANRLIEQLTKG